MNNAPTLGPRGWAIVCGGLALAARLPLAFDRYDASLVPDAGGYLRLADGLLAGRGYPTDYRTPGYPAFIALIQLLPGRREDVLVLLQHLIGVALVVAVLLVTWRWFGRASAIAASVLAALAPILINVEHEVLPDFLFGLIVLGGTLLLAEACAASSPRVGVLLAVGVVYGIATYVKPTGQVLLFAAVVPLAFATRSLRRTVTGSAALACGLALTVSPWIVRNGLEYGNYVMSIQGPQALYLRVFDQDRLPVPTETPEGRLAARIGAQTRARTPAEVEVTESYSYVLNTLLDRGLEPDEAVAIQGELAVTAIRRDPLAYAAGTARNFFVIGAYSSEPRQPLAGLLLKLDGTESPLPRPLVAAPWVVGAALALVWLLVSIGGLAAIGLLFTGSRPARVRALTLASVWVLVAAATALTSAPNSRYAAQIVPLYWMLGSGGAALVLRATHRRLKRTSEVAQRR